MHEELLPCLGWDWGKSLGWVERFTKGKTIEGDLPRFPWATYWTKASTLKT